MKSEPLSVLRLRRFSDFLWLIFPAAILLGITPAQIVGALIAGLWVALPRRRSAPAFPREIAWPLAAFLGWMLLSVAVQGPTLRDLRDAAGKWSFALLLVPAYLQGESAARMRKTLFILVGAVAASFPYYVWTAFFTEYGRASSFSGGAPNLGTILMMATVILASWAIHTRGWRRTRFGLIAVLTLAGLLLTLNRSAALGVAAALAIVLGRRSPALLAAAVAVAAALLALFPESTIVSRLRTIPVYKESFSSRERVRMWGSGIRMIADRPVFGFRSRHNFMEEYRARYRDPESEEQGTPGHVHNSVLQTTILHGIPGLLLFGWLFVALWRRAWWWYRRTMKIEDPLLRALAGALIPLLAAVLVNAQFDFIIADGQRAMMFYVLTGLILGSLSAELRDSAKKRVAGSKG